MMVLNTYIQPINDELIILMELLSRGILTLTIAFGLLFLDTTGVFNATVRRWLLLSSQHSRGCIKLIRACSHVRRCMSCLLCWCYTVSQLSCLLQRPSPKALLQDEGAGTEAYARTWRTAAPFIGCKGPSLFAPWFAVWPERHRRCDRYPQHCGHCFFCVGHGHCREGSRGQSLPLCTGESGGVQSHAAHRRCLLE